MRELYPIAAGVFGGAIPPAVPAAFQAAADEHMPAWYALTVKHQHERAIARALMEKGFEAFAPTYRARRQWSDRTKEIECPLFAGYVFCQFAGAAKWSVLDTPAVGRVVEFGGRPAAVANAEIEALRRIVASRLGARPWPRLKAGDRVRIERGPLRGLEGVLIRENETLELVVGVELLQRSVAVRIDADAVAPVVSAPPVVSASRTAQQAGWRAPDTPTRAEEAKARRDSACAPQSPFAIRSCHK